jgi:hypothetical protein
MTFAKTLASAAALMVAASAVQAQDATPAVIFDLGGKFDKSFNQASYEGAERFKAETGTEYAEFELQNDAQREQALRRFAQQGHNPVIVTGFSYGSAMETVAPEFPAELTGRLGDETAFFRALGAICGQRMRLLAGLEDCVDADLSYEALTADPAAAAAALVAAFPLLAGLDPQAAVAVKDYAPQRLRNMNAAQLAALTPRQLAAITDGLRPHAAAVTALGYRLREPGALVAAE